MEEKKVRLTDFLHNIRFKGIIIAYNSGGVVEDNRWRVHGECVSDSIAIFNLDEKLIFLSDNVERWCCDHEPIMDYQEFEHITVRIFTKSEKMLVGIFSLEGNIIIPVDEYSEWYGFEKAIRIYTNKGECRIYSYNGTHLATLGTSPQFYKNFFLASSRDPRSYIDGRIIIPDDVSFERGLSKGIVVSKDGKRFGIYDFEGNVIFPCEYINYKLIKPDKDKEIIVFDNEIGSEVYSEDFQILFKTEGNYVDALQIPDELRWPISSTFLTIFSTKTRRYGVIDYKGKQILPLKFTMITQYDRFIKPYKGNLCGLYLAEKEILPVDFFKISISQKDANEITAKRWEKLIEESYEIEDFSYEINEYGYLEKEWYGTGKFEPAKYETYYDIYKYDEVEEKAVLIRQY